MAQRKSRKNSTLAEQRVRLLDELGFEWLPTWETQFEELLAYRHRHGDCLVPQSYRCNPQLGIWVRTQRRSHRHGSMLATRAKRLDALGFHWGSNPCEDSQHWEARFCELQEKAAGSPRWLPEEGNPLARWLEAQAHEHQMGRLSEDRCRRLGFLLGAAWSGGWAQPYSSSVELSWQEGLRLVDERIEREGGIHSVSRDPSLVAWISNQRQLHSKGGLSDGPVRRLRDLGLLREGSDAMAGDLPDAPAQESGVSAVPLSPANSEWWRFHQLLAAFQEKHGHCNVPGAANPRLAAWVARQRTLAASGALRPDRAAALGGLGFSWREDSPLRPAAEVWETRFQELVDFRLQHGHCRVPRADRVLGEWVVMQRYLRRRGSLAAEYVSRLDHAGFDWSEGSEGQGTANLRRTAPQPCDRDASRCWELHFQELLDYHVEHGHCRVPEDDPELAPLAGWVRLQVYRCEVGSAPEDQMRQLRSLGLELNNRWSERLAELTAYMRENGDCSMPAGGKYRHLHRWAEEQREAMRNNRLEAEKVRQLDKLGFCWE